MTERIPLKDFGPAVPFERKLRNDGMEYLKPVMSTVVPMNADQLAEASFVPRRQALQMVCAMVRAGTANFDSPDTGWTLAE